MFQRKPQFLLRKIVLLFPPPNATHDNCFLGVSIILGVKGRNNLFIKHLHSNSYVLSTMLWNTHSYYPNLRDEKSYLSDLVTFPEPHS